MTKANVKQEFGTAVRTHRLRLGLSQETLAERAQLHRTYVTDVERGSRNISLESISRLAGALNLPISSLFSQPRSSRGTTGAGEPVDVDILLVEDDPADVELTLAAFATAKLSNRIEVVRDGATALDFLLRRGAYSLRRNQTGPLVVLLDLHLPRMHGLEVLQRLRSEGLTDTIQVVVLTNSRLDADVRQAMALGAKAYVVKPLDFQAFSAVTPHLNVSWALLNASQPKTDLTAGRRTSLKS